jgi:predicted nucleic acid-binding protein
MYAFPILRLVGQDMALKSADNYRFLRKRGITIRKTIDCLIATFCIEHTLDILHSDSDFDPFEQHLHLNVVHP